MPKAEAVLLLPGIGGINSDGIDTYGIQIAKLNRGNIQLHKYFSFDIPSNLVGKVICSGTISGKAVVCMCTAKKCAVFVATSDRHSGIR